MISDLKDKYCLEEGISAKLTDKAFLNKLTDIDGFDIGGAYIKKNKNGFYELQQWIVKPIGDDQDGDDSDDNVNDSDV